MNNANLKRLIKEKGVTLKECAEDTGISYRTLLRYTKGKSGQLTNFRILANYLGVKLDEILVESKEEN